jgi:hypothetical protein
MAKLTLSVDPRVIRQAKRYASQHNVSVSSLVESYLNTISAEKPFIPGPQPEPPVVRRLRGILKAGDIGDYRDHLAKKYL